MKGMIVIDKERCKGCSLCVNVCPHQLIELGNFFNKQGYQPVVFKNSEECTGCTLCAIVCPDVAIEVYREVKNGKENINEG